MTGIESKKSIFYFYGYNTILKSDHTSQIHARLEMRSQNCFKKPDIVKLQRPRLFQFHFPQTNLLDEFRR